MLNNDSHHQHVLAIGMALLVSTIVGAFAYYSGFAQGTIHPLVTPTPTPSATAKVSKSTPTITPSSGVASQTDSTTYTNELGSFSVQLPTGYIISRSGSCEGICTEALTVSKKDSGISYASVGISLDVSKDIMTRDEFVKSFSGHENFKDLGEITIDGVKAKKYSDAGLIEVIRYLFVRGDYTYSISVDDTSPKEVEDSIVKTFKFTK